MYDAAREIVRAWGFEYVKIGFVWVKTNAGGAPAPGGLGYSTREQAEFCIYARRGCPKRLDAGVQQVVMAPRGRHSEKPEEVARRVERLFPGPYLELFARTRRPGWDAWGNEAPAAIAPSGAPPNDEKEDE
jgi:N6-adenosine-specific RNA methylase IME4